MSDKKKAGRPTSNNPKNKMIYVRVTEEEKKQLEEKANLMKMTISELLIKGAFNL